MTPGVDSFCACGWRREDLANQSHSTLRQVSKPCLSFIFNISEKEVVHTKNTIEHTKLGMTATRVQI